MRRCCRGRQRAARASKKQSKVMYKEEALLAHQRMAAPAPSIIALP
jgi:hypothetical protein